MKHWLRHPALTLALSASLVLASGPAAALGLGQIEVRSRAGQPLLAEIPIITSDPAELEALQARLASPETFARVGLQAPQGVVAGLQFTIGSNARGRPVIRVTSDAPIEQPLVTFLIEVEWDQGRLVREYSALVDAPRTVAAPVQTPIQAPTVAPPNVVQRPVVAPSRPVGEPPRPAAPTGQDTQGASPGEYGPVRRGESLSLIANRLGLADGNTLNQAMVALLRANPDAFIGGDINQLRRGAVLRVPAPSEVAAIDAAQASEIVRTRLQQWRQSRQPATPAATAAAAVEPAARTAPAAPAGRAAPTGGARLEIVPPAAGRAKRPGTQSGIEVGGEGRMLSQELQETKETLAARDAELQELKSRIAELERLQADQQRLLELKDTELASVQKRVATAQQQPVPAPAPEPQPREATWWPWLLGAAALLAAALGWWWRRRSPETRPAFRVPPESSSAPSLAAAFPSREPPRADELPAEAEPPRVDDAPEPVEDPVLAMPAVATPTVASTPVEPGAAPVEEPAAAAQPAPAPFVPLWHSPLPERPADAPPAVPAEPTGPDLHVDADEPAPAAVPVADPGESTPEHRNIMEAVEAAITPRNERIELARAYIELGDHDSARQLLGEVVVTGDHASRQQAMRMLREID